MRQTAFDHRFYKSLLGRKIALLFLAAWLCAPAGFGQNITRPNIVAPSGIQVNSYTGSLFCKRPDFFIPVPGLPLDISFAYSSANRATNLGFGAGWTFSYNQWYTIDTAGGITIHRGDGREDRFTPEGSAFKAPSGIFDVLAQYETGKYRLTGKDGTSHYFESSSHRKLTKIVDRYYNKILLTYGSDNSIAGISDGMGHTVSFTWAGSHVSEITASAGSDARKIQYDYNALGQLNHVKKPMGVVISYTYGGNKGMSQYADGNGNTTDILYNSNNAVMKLVSCGLEQRIAYNPDQHKTYVTEVDDGKTFATTYAFDAAGRLINRSGNCCGFNTSFEYDASNNVTKIKDGNGGTRVFTYDSKGNLMAETDQLQHTTHYTYDPEFNQVASVTDKNGHLTTYGYQPTTGNLVITTDALSHFAEYFYNPNGSIQSATDKKSLSTKYGYDAYGYLNMVVGPMQDTTLLENDAWGNVTTKTNPRHAVTHYAYDSLDRLTTVVTVNDALTDTTRFDYDANGNRTAATDPLGHPTHISYNWLNKPVRVTDALNHSTTLSYDGKGNLLSRTDANGHTTSFSYDDHSRLLSTTNAAGESSSYDYDGVGNRTAMSTPNGNTVRFTYDAANRLTKITDNQGAIAEYSYDAGGNKLSEQDGQGNAISYQYDALDRVASVTDALGNASTYGYDNNNNLTQVIDRNSHTTSYTYDNLDRRTSEAVDGSLISSAVFDKAGNLASVTDGNNNNTLYTYNALDQLTREKFVDLTTKDYTYDRAGNLKTRKDHAGQTTTFTYDAANRPVLRAYSATLADTFAFDSVGLLTRAVHPGATLTYSYDPANRIAGEVLNGKTTSYTYHTAAGRRTITYPGGRQITRQTDARSQLSALSENGGQVIAAYEYDLAGRNTKRTFQNGTVTNLSFDGNSRVTNLSHNPAHFVEFSYTYDQEGNPTATQFQHLPAHSEQYTHDSKHQLTGFTKAATPNTYTYDAVGNRTQAQIAGQGVSYTVTTMNAYSDILYGSTPVALNYDPNGNLTGDGAHTYAFDRENRLVTVDGGTTARYDYDALGRRIRKIAGGDTTQYFYDGLRIVEERNGADSTLATYVWGRWVDDIVSMRRGGQSYFYHTNTLGSVVSVTNAAGQVAERYEYDAFGKVTVFDSAFVELTNGTSIGNLYLYSGRELDQETGLYYYRARYYDPKSGRFIQRDPIGYGDGMGVYAYVGNRALTFIDPMGTKAKAPCNRAKSPSDGNPEWLSYIPVVGSARDAVQDFKNGDYGWAAFNAAMAVSDVFLVKSLVVSTGKIITKTAWKTGSTKWKSAVRPWLGKNGMASKGQHVHHWLLEQKFIKEKNLEWLGNQPWNLTPMPSPEFHTLVHNYGPIGWALGTPGWAKAWFLEATDAIENQTRDDYEGNEPNSTDNDCCE